MNCVVWKDENKQKEAEIGPFFIKTNIQMKEMWIKRGRSKLKSDKLQFRQNKKNGLFLWLLCPDRKLDGCNSSSNNTNNSCYVNNKYHSIK